MDIKFRNIFGVDLGRSSCAILNNLALALGQAFLKLE